MCGVHDGTVTAAGELTWPRSIRMRTTYHVVESPKSNARLVLLLLLVVVVFNICDANNIFHVLHWCMSLYVVAGGF